MAISITANAIGSTERILSEPAGLSEPKREINFILEWMTGMGFRAGTQKHDGREEKILLFSIRPRCNYRCVDAHKFG